MFAHILLFIDIDTLLTTNFTCPLMYLTSLLPPLLHTHTSFLLLSLDSVPTRNIRHYWLASCCNQDMFASVLLSIDINHSAVNKLCMSIDVFHLALLQEVFIGPIYSLYIGISGLLDSALKVKDLCQFECKTDALLLNLKQ